MVVHPGGKSLTCLQAAGAEAGGERTWDVPSGYGLVLGAVQLGDLFSLIVWVVPVPL